MPSKEQQKMLHQSGHVTQQRMMESEGFGGSSFYNNASSIKEKNEEQESNQHMIT